MLLTLTNRQVIGNNSAVTFAGANGQFEASHPTLILQ